MVWQLCVGERFPARRNSTLQWRHHTVTSKFCNSEITNTLVCGWYNASQEPPAGSKLAFQELSMLPSNTPPRNAGLSPGKTPDGGESREPLDARSPSPGWTCEVVPGPWADHIIQIFHGSGCKLLCDNSVYSSFAKSGAAAIIPHFDESAEGLILTTCL